MPNHEHRNKRVRQSMRKRALNLWRKRRLKDATKTLQEAIQKRDIDAAENAFRKTCSLLDRFSYTSTLHKNTAARRKSRMSARIKALKDAPKD